MNELIEVVSVQHIQDYLLCVEFSTGEQGIVDIESFLNGPVFEPLKDPAYFKKAFIDSAVGTIAWPNGANISPEKLYEASKIMSQAARCMVADAG